MRYLFFDIECADGSKAICEFGYVLTDEKFNIIRKRNILIDPECHFNLAGRVGQDDLSSLIHIANITNFIRLMNHMKRLRIL